jgi:LacI family transcriptional regulator
MRARVSIKDIAKHIGTSPSTVSRALNPKTSRMISSKVVTKVKLAASKLGYTVDLIAASLRNQRTFTVGLVLPSIPNPVFAPITKSIQECLTKHDIVTFTLFTGNNKDEAVATMHKLVSRNVDGVIIGSEVFKNLNIDFCIDKNIPLVTVDLCTSNCQLIHQVNDDENHGLELAIDHLIALGHHHIAYIAGPQDTSQGIKRKECFMSHCSTKKIQTDLFQSEAFSVVGGNVATTAFITNKCGATAIVAGDDSIAAGAIQCLLANNVNVPGHVSIVGYNDMPFAEMLCPTLTTVSIASKRIGHDAAYLLLSAIENQDAPTQKLVLAPILAVRASTAPPPHR